MQDFSNLVIFHGGPATREPLKFPLPPFGKGKGGGSVPNFFSTTSVEAHRKDGVEFFREREGAFTSGPTNASNRTGKKSLSKKATSRPETGPWIKPLPGPTISSAAIITRRIEEVNTSFDAVHQTEFRFWELLRSPYLNRHIFPEISPSPSLSNPAQRGTPFCKGREGGI